MTQREDIDACWIGLQNLLKVSEKLFIELKAPFQEEKIAALQEEQELSLQHVLDKLQILQENWDLNLNSDHEEMLPLKHLHTKIDRLQRRFTSNLEIRSKMVSKELEDIRQAKRKLKSLKEVYGVSPQKKRERHLDTRS